MTNCCQFNVALCESQPLFEIVDVRSTCLESGVLENFLVQRHVGLDAFNDDLGERMAHARKRGVAVMPVRDHLANHRIVERRYVITTVDVRVDANARPRRLMCQGNEAR